MKIAVPTNSEKGLDDEIAKHFGRCPTYTFINEKGQITEIINNSGQHMGGIDSPPELIKKYGADVLLCRDIGPKAINLCKKLGIDVYVHDTQTVKEIFDMWQNKKIQKANLKDACKNHKKI